MIYDNNYLLRYFKAMLRDLYVMLCELEVNRSMIHPCYAPCIHWDLNKHASVYRGVSNMSRKNDKKPKVTNCFTNLQCTFFKVNAFKTKLKSCYILCCGIIRYYFYLFGLKQMDLHVALCFMSNIEKKCPPPGSDAYAIYKFFWILITSIPYIIKNDIHTFLFL